MRGRWTAAGKPVILVAEDEPLIRRWLETVLTKAGYVVLSACDGQEALTLSMGHPSDIPLLVSNIEMPRINGYDLSTRIRETRPGIKVLLISGHTSARLRELASHPDFLQKPFPMEVLLMKLEDMLSTDGPDRAEV